jgi:hypothetical protein
MKASSTLLRDWARQRPQRTFEIRYIGRHVKFPWAVDLENSGTMATVHVECHANLRDAVREALKLAAKDEAI